MFSLIPYELGKIITLHPPHCRRFPTTLTMNAFVQCGDNLPHTDNRHMHTPFIFVPLLTNRARRVIVPKHLHHLTMNDIIVSAIEGIHPQEKSHAVAINTIRCPVDGYDRLLSCLPLAGEEVWHKDPLLAKADN